MFKQNNCADELLYAMEKSLLAKQAEDTHGFNKLAQVADYLNEAASIFEQAEMHQEAEQITEVLLDLANQLSSNNTSSF